MKHLNIIVEGKVQGVFYRDSTRQKAKSFGIKGFVRNEPDGTVYIEAEGEAKKLKALIQWCKTGSPKSHVSDVSFTEGNVQGYTDFKVVFK